MAAIVLLPAPETPITTMTVGAASTLTSPARQRTRCWLIAALRRSVAVHKPNQLSFRIGASSRQICPLQHPGEDLSFGRAADEEQHFACRCQSWKGQGDARDERFEGGFRHPDDPTCLLIQLGMAGEKRCRMAVRAQPHQHHVKQWTPGDELFRAVKAMKLRFVQARGIVYILDVCDYRVNVARGCGNVVEQQPARDAEIAERVIMRHEAVVANEPMDVIPRQSIAVGFGCQQRIEALRGRAASEADGEATA